MAHETIISNAEITVNGEVFNVKVDHIIDGDEYTEHYIATVGRYQRVLIEMGEEGFWIESESKEATDLAGEIGRLIESYSE